MQQINVIALGVYRHVAATMDTVFENTPYRLSAIIDLKSEPEAFTYSAHNLGAVLHNLHPPPQVFVVGAAISESMAKDAIGMWEEYIKNRGTEDTLVIELQAELVSRGNWKAHIMGKLDVRYKNNEKDRNRSMAEN